MAAAASNNLVRPATVDYVHDGDTPVCTFRVAGDVGFVRTRIRVDHINAPESGTPAGDDATAFAKTLVAPGDTVTLTSHGPLGSRDNYGRFVAVVTLPDGRDWGQVMLDSGHASPLTVHTVAVEGDEG
jgi:endonuclease YncB( thermonuclease family)